MENFLELNNEQMLDIDGGSLMSNLFEDNKFTNLFYFLLSSYYIYKLSYAVGTAIAHLTR